MPPHPVSNVKPGYYDRYVRQPNRRTQHVVRTNRRWTDEDDETLAREWVRHPGTGWHVNVALRLDRTLVACIRRVTMLRNRGRMPR